MPAALFRADASAAIGTGHVVRCLTLATHLLGRGWTAALAGRFPPELARDAAAAGIAVHELPPGMAAADEPGHLAAAGALADGGVVVTDHYGLAAPWQRAIRSPGRVLAAIDDLAAEAQDVDLLLNQNLGATPERYRGLVPASAVVLAGPMFALLRPAFAEARAAAAPRDGTVRRLLVFLSGADEHDVTARAAAAAATTGLPTDVVIGGAYPFADRLRAWAASRPSVTVHVNTPEMPALMAAASLAIGAPSSASWERCAVGLPSVLVLLADNQLEAGTALASQGAAELLGWHHDVTERELADAVSRLVASPARLRDMAAAAAQVTDGLGTGRVADALEALVTREPR